MTPEPEHRPTDLAGMRQRYERPPLHRRDLAPTWEEQLRVWLDEAQAAGIPEPNAMVLATASVDGRPRTRTVLLKDLAPERLTFYTNYTSAKGRDLAQNPWCSVTFPWIAMARQVVVVGRARRGSDEDSDAYFASRPHGSKVGAVASPQSEVLASRDVLEEREAAARARYPEGTEVPRPWHWGGYEIVPTSVEFWQGREDRLHDRLQYVRAADGGWIVERLAP